jgi:uncharacterized repeat protein (TIGR03803 family)
MTEISAASHGNWLARRLILSVALAFAITSAANAGGRDFEPGAKWNETVLHKFTGGSDGGPPLGGLIMGSAGNLYGDTLYGGGNCSCGTVFKLAPGGALTVLYEFQGGTDGSFPEGGLISDSQGNLYGTTESGGNSTNCGFGCGTVFEVTPTGKETVLYNFQAGDDGAFPAGGLMMDESGNLYGTTRYGGGNNAACGSGGAGTAFELKPNGQESVLHAFGSGSDGACPVAGLIRDGNGNLYGTTEYGGGSANCADNLGCGTVFKIASDGTESALYAFQNGADGADPTSSLLLDNVGNLYGTTDESSDQFEGVIFRIAPDGMETVLHTFRGGKKDGSEPFGGVTMDANGDLFGATSAGGCAVRSCCPSDGGCGTVFELPAKGRETILYTFRGVRGVRPQGALLLGAQGQLYGTTQMGGTKKGNGGGVVFELQP